MKGVEVIYRDATARSGKFLGEDGVEHIFPAAYDMDSIFPVLTDRERSFIPPLEEPEFVKRFFLWDQKEPVPVHIHADSSVLSGDTVITPGWHTLLNRPRDLLNQLEVLKTKFPPDTCWYLPGAALPDNVAVLVHLGFDIFDFKAVDLASSREQFCLPDGVYPKNLMEEGVCPCNGCKNGDLFEHNRINLQAELALIKRKIHDGTMRDLVEVRCRSRSVYVSMMRIHDLTDRMEQSTPVSRSVPLIASSGDCLHRVEVRRFADRLCDRYIPPISDVAVIIPCSAKKPYSLSKSHQKFIQAISRRAHELILTSPLGLVPRDIELAYPAACYDVPVTGYWDHEERYQITRTLVRYFQRHPYKIGRAHV